MRCVDQAAKHDAEDLVSSTRLEDEPPATLAIPRAYLGVVAVAAVSAAAAIHSSIRPSTSIVREA